MKTLNYFRITSFLIFCALSCKTKHTGTPSSAPNEVDQQTTSNTTSNPLPKDPNAAAEAVYESAMKSAASLQAASLQYVNSLGLDDATTSKNQLAQMAATLAMTNTGDLVDVILGLDSPTLIFNTIGDQNIMSAVAAKNTGTGLALADSTVTLGAGGGSNSKGNSTTVQNDRGAAAALGIVAGMAILYSVNQFYQEATKKPIATTSAGAPIDTDPELTAIMSTLRKQYEQSWFSYLTTKPTFLSAENKAKGIWGGIKYYGSTGIQYISGFASAAKNLVTMDPPVNQIQYDYLYLLQAQESKAKEYLINNIKILVRATTKLDKQKLLVVADEKIVATSMKDLENSMARQIKALKGSIDPDIQKKEMNLKLFLANLRAESDLDKKVGLITSLQTQLVALEGEMNDYSDHVNTVYAVLQHNKTSYLQFQDVVNTAKTQASSVMKLRKTYVAKLQAEPGSTGEVLADEFESEVELRVRNPTKYDSLVANFIRKTITPNIPSHSSDSDVWELVRKGAPIAIAAAALYGAISYSNAATNATNATNLDDSTDSSTTVPPLLFEYSQILANDALIKMQYAEVLAASANN